MIYVFDLDGTLINSTRRHWVLMKLLLQQTIHVDEYFQDDFTAYKAAGNSGYMYLTNCLRLSHDAAESLQSEWIQHIEDEPYLAMDTLYEDTKETLSRITGRIILLTKRENTSGLLQELKRLDISEYETIILKHGESKADILKRLDDECIMIGDTEDDYNAATEAGCNYYILNRGFRSEVYWRQLGVISHPDLSQL